jgi:predicted  nucleic acid-binding Zn-ribbon protein
MSNKNEIFEYLIDQLRQQVNNNQCEDLVHEVQSLKNQLRDMSEVVDELQEDNIKKSEHISHLTGQVKELHLALVKATGDAEAYKLIREQEQSGCRKEDAQECEHDWVRDIDEEYFECRRCGVTKSGECEHEWQFYGVGFPCMCLKCGLKK